MSSIRAILLVSTVFLFACGDDESSSNNTTSNNTTSNNTTANNSNNATNNATNNTANNTNNATNNANNVLSIEVTGTWTTNFDGTETITATTWNNGFVEATIELYDNDNNFAVLLNPASDEFNPNKYSLIEWTEPADNMFHYCTVDFGLDSLDEALNSEVIADPADLDGEGCGGFPWTQMTAQ